jgi:putative ABC transport system substrate-binding protein
MPLRRIGVLYPGRHDREFDEWRPLFLEALKAFAWEDGRNVGIEWRFAEYDQRLHAPLAADLVRMGVDAVLAAGTPLTRALQQATREIPIVTGVGDPVGSGFAKDLAKPGGNITGLSWSLREKAREQVRLLRELVPTVRRLLILRSLRYGDISELNSCLERVADESGMEVEVCTVESFDEVEVALKHLAGLMTDAAFTYAHGSFQFDASQLAEAAIRHRVATVCDERLAVEAGGLMSYTLHHADKTRRFASLIDQVLRGVNPAEIPFEPPTTSEFVINRRTAASLGLVIPPNVLLRADAVIG